MRRARLFLVLVLVPWLLRSGGVSVVFLSSPGDAIDSGGTAGEFITLVCTAPGVWESFGRSGNWVDGGAD